MTGDPPAPRIAVPERIDEAAVSTLDRSPSIAELSGDTMGTRWHVKLALPVSHDPAPIHEAIQARLDSIVAEMSHWEASSDLSLFNASPGGSWTALPPDFATVMAAALEVAEASHGAFDPALGRLTDAWGLGPNPPANELPAPALLGEALEASGWGKLAFDPAGGRLRQPGGLWLDLSGIAKGFAADAVADLLAELGLHHALVEVGGECVGRGLRPDFDPWWVELEAPSYLTQPPLRIALHQLAVATSGNYLRGAHAIDGRSGDIASAGPIAISVIHRSCMLADAWASAFAVLTEAEGRELARSENLAVRAITPIGSEWLSDELLNMMM